MNTRATAGLRSIGVGDLARIQWPIEPQLRPDGGAVAYVVSGLDPQLDALSYALRLLDLESGADRELLSAARSPRWSHDGRSLAYVAAAKSGGSLAVLHPTQVGVEDGTAAVVAADDVIDFVWAPADARLAILVAHPAGSGGACSLLIGKIGSATERVDVDLLEPRLVRWSPDGRRLAIACGNDGLDGRSLESSVVVVDLELPSKREVLSWSGPIRNLTWSPDGTHLALLGHDRGPAGWEPDGIWIVAADGSRTEITAGHDMSFGRVVRGDDERGLGCPALHWPDDGSGIVTTVVRHGCSSVAKVTMDGRIDELLGGPRAILELTMSKSGAFVVSWSDPLTPGELSFVACSAEHVITDINAEWRTRVALAPTVELSARDHSDPGNPQIDGWLTLPVGRASSPMVMQVHGGPHHAVGMRFSFDAQRLASQGIAVLRGNPRGSDGRGRRFAEAICGDWGGPDLRDVLALVEAAARRPDIDGERIAIIGESYGGFLVNWAITATDRFVAAIAENSISDPLPLALGPRGPNFWWLEFDASPHEHPERFSARSASANVESIATPLLLVHAQDDDNCFIGQSESMLAALEQHGGSVQMIRVPDEGHLVNVFGRLSSRVERTEEIDRFLLNHLFVPAQPRPQSTTA